MFRKKICNLSELENKNYIKLWVNELKDEVIVFMKNEKIYVKSSICPHFGGAISLDENNNYLTCYWHGLKFSFDGKCLNNKNFRSCLGNYEYELKNNNIYIKK